MRFSLENLKDLREVIKELAVGLLKLDLVENTESFEVDITISATSEIQIRNELQFVPSKYIIVSQTGNGLVTKSSTSTWDSNYLYLYNNGASSVTVTVIFMR